MGNCRGAPSAAAAHREAEERRQADIKKAAEKRAEEERQERERSKTAAEQMNFMERARKAKDRHGESLGPPSEDLQWLNFAVKEIWPYADKSIRRLMMENVVPQLQAKMPAGFTSITFSKFELGKEPPKLGPVHVRKQADPYHPGVELDIGVDWVFDGQIEVSLGSGSLGIEALTVKGQVLLVLKPLMDSLPIVGGMQLTMIAPPEIDFKFNGLAKVVHFPTIKGTIKGAIRDVVSNLLVLPHRMFIHWVPGREREIDLSAMQFPLPEAFMRLGVVQARGLRGLDWQVFGKSTSDPYARITVGAQSYDTPVRPKTLEPDWGDEGYCDFSVYTLKQLLIIELFDEDNAMLGGGGDDSLGELRDKDGKHVALCDFLLSGEEWWPIYAKETGSDGKPTWNPSGEIRIKHDCFSLVADRGAFQEINKPDKHGKADSDGILEVKIRGLRGLPQSLADGCVIKCTLSWPAHVGKKPIVVSSQKSKYTEPVSQREDLEKVDATVQRMVEFLKMECNKDEATIVNASGLTEAQVKGILEIRPSFITKWDQALHIPISFPEEAELKLQLVLPKDGAQAAPIELTSKFLLKERVFPKDKLVTEEVLQLKRNDSGIRGAFDGPFDLDVSVQLHGLMKVPADPAPASPGR